MVVARRASALLLAMISRAVASERVLQGASFHRTPFARSVDVPVPGMVHIDRFRSCLFDFGPGHEPAGRLVGGEEDIPVRGYTEPTR